MNKRLLEVYALSVCFVSMICLSIFSGILLYSIIELSFPSLTNFTRVYYSPPVYSEIEMSTAAAFPGQVPPEFSTSVDVGNNPDINKPSQDEQKRFEELEIKRVKAESIMSIIRSIIVIFITSIIFFFHWRIAKKARG